MTETLIPISISKILVAFDGSDHSKKAMELGVSLALKSNAELYLIHVMEEMNMPEALMEYARIEHVDPSTYFDGVNEHYLEPAEERAKAAGVKKVELVTMQGDAAEEILKIAQNLKVDLIILGSRGHGKFPRAFLGSVSTKVLNHANCTCITVK